MSNHGTINPGFSRVGASGALATNPKTSALFIEAVENRSNAGVGIKNHLKSNTHDWRATSRLNYNAAGGKSKVGKSVFVRSGDSIPDLKTRCVGPA
jgi:hypothetical protein